MFWWFGATESEEAKKRKLLIECKWYRHEQNTHRRPIITIILATNREKATRADNANMLHTLLSSSLKKRFWSNYCLLFFSAASHKYTLHTLNAKLSQQKPIQPSITCQFSNYFFFILLLPILRSETALNWAGRLDLDGSVCQDSQGEGNKYGRRVLFLVYNVIGIQFQPDCNHLSGRSDSEKLFQFKFRSPI